MRQGPRCAASPEITRRVFLGRGGMTLLSLGLAPLCLARTAFAERTRARKALVAIFQRGAVDGLSMVVPHGEGDYYRRRPRLAIARPGEEGSAIDLDGFFGLHPRLAPLEPLWRAGELAIVHACGSPDATRSHFEAQDYMESGTPGVKRTADGWLNRCLGLLPETGAALRGVALTTKLPRALEGPRATVAFRELSKFGIRSATLAQGFQAEYAEAADRLLGGSARGGFEVLETLGRIDRTAYRPPAGVRYPPTALGGALGQVARLIKADVGVEVAFAEMGGWDTHANQGTSEGQLARRFDDFGRSLSALVADLGARMADVVILTMSEFGRTVAENGSLGTDHGHGTAMLVMGGGVRGGRMYGRWPGLASDRLFEGRDLAVTTDFRDLFAEVAVRHLGVQRADEIFPGHVVDRRHFLGLFA